MHGTRSKSPGYTAGLENGLSEDELVAYELGAVSKEELSEVQLAYLDKIKSKLVQVRGRV
jgi:hypothetical protein